MCENCKNGEFCATCAKNEIYNLKGKICDLEEANKTLNLRIFFLKIDESFKNNFSANYDKLLLKAIDALEIEDQYLDMEFYHACDRIRKMYSKETDKCILAKLYALQAFEISYTKSKHRFYD